MCSFWQRYWIEVSCVPSIVLHHASHHMVLVYRHIKFVAAALDRSILVPSTILHHASYNMAFVHKHAQFITTPLDRSILVPSIVLLCASLD